MGFVGDLSAVGGCKSAAHRESHDDYSHTLCVSGEFRVIICKDNLQWIIQRRDNPQKTLAGARWRGLSYCRSRKALVRLWRAKTGQTGGALEALPENFDGTKL